MNRKTVVNPNFSILMLVMCEIRITGLQMEPVRNKLNIKSVLQPPYHIFDWSPNVIPCHYRIHDEVFKNSSRISEAKFLLEIVIPAIYVFALDFCNIKFEKLSLMNWIFCLIQTGFLLPA